MRRAKTRRVEIRTQYLIYDSPLYLTLGKDYEVTGEPVVDLLSNIHLH